jgi:hypothetical protein
MTPSRNAEAPVPRLDRQTLIVAGVSIAITAYIGLVLAYLRSDIQNPFNVPVFRHLIFFQDYYALLPFAGILALALLSPVRALGVHAAALCARHAGWVALAATAALAAGTQLVYHNHPLSMDEYALVYQSTIFSEGRLTGQYPAALLDWLAPPWQHTRFIRMSAETGATVSGYWPGMSLLLTPFTALGVPWLLNPLLGGATLLVMHRLALAIFGDTENAGYAVLLTLASPAVTINALSYYSMPGHLLANAIFALLLLRPTPGRALLAGLVGSVALVLHNPPPHILFALPWIAWLALRSDRVKLLGALAAGYLPLCLVLGWGWAYFLESQASTAAAGAAAGSLATPAGAVEMLMGRIRGFVGWTSETGSGGQLYSLAKLWVWAVPGLLSVAALGAWRLRKETGFWLALIGSALLTYFAYFLVRFDQGHGWGFRYFHSAWLALPLLAIAACRAAAAPAALRSYLAGCAVLSLAILSTLHALHVEHFIARHLSQVPVAAAGDARVVILNRGYYTWDLAQNDPFLRNAPIMLYTRNPQLDLEMMRKHFPRYQLLHSDHRGSVWGLARP